MTWIEWLNICEEALGIEKPIVTISDEEYIESSKKMMAEKQDAGIDPGLDMVKFADLQLSNMFIDKELGCVPLGVEPDDIKAAISESMQLSKEIIDGKVADTVDMKTE